MLNGNEGAGVLMLMLAGNISPSTEVVPVPIRKGSVGLGGVRGVNYCGRCAQGEMQKCGRYRRRCSFLVRCGGLNAGN